MDLEIEKTIIDLKNSRDSLINSSLQLDKIVNEKQETIDKLEEILQKIREIVNNDKITGIETKLMIKDLLKENK